MELKKNRKVNTKKLPKYVWGKNQNPMSMGWYGPKDLYGNNYGAGYPMGLGTPNMNTNGLQVTYPQNQQFTTPSKPAGKFDMAKGGNIATSAVAFAGDTINAFGSVKNENQLMAESGKTQSNGIGFSYDRQNEINSSAQLRELSKENTGNTLKTTATGAALGASIGSIFPGFGTVIGGAVGAVVGLGVGLFGGASRRNKLKRRIANAQEQVRLRNNFASSEAQSDYMAQNYALENGNTQDDILYAKHGKNAGEGKETLKQTVSAYTSLGKQQIQPNAKVAAGESIIDNINDVSNTTGHIVKDGKLNQDTNYANVNESTIILGGDTDWRTGTTFRDQALPYTDALEQINKKFENRTNDKLNKLRGTIGKESDDTQQYEVNKLKQPIVDKLKDLADQQKNQHEMIRQYSQYQYKNGKDYLPRYAGGFDLGNTITSGLGSVASIYQTLSARNQNLHMPDIYAGNPYENAALTTMAGLRVSPYKALEKIYENQNRQNYLINRSGGLSGAQKYLANAQAYIQSNKDIKDAIYDSQIQNNQYKGQYAQALMNAGQAYSQRRQAANQYNEEYYARAHAARLQGEQMGIRNLLDQMQQYYANDFKLRQFNDTMDLYRQDVKNKADEIRTNKASQQYVNYGQMSTLKNNPFNVTLTSPQWAPNYKTYLNSLNR